MGNGLIVDAMALMAGSGFVVYAGAALAKSFFPTVMRDLPGRVTCGAIRFGRAVATALPVSDMDEHWRRAGRGNGLRVH